MTPEGCLQHASGFEGNLYGNDEPLGGNASLYDWTFHPAFDITRIADMANSQLGNADWISWFQDEQEDRASDGQPGYYDSLLLDPIRGEPCRETGDASSCHRRKEAICLNLLGCA